MVSNALFTSYISQSPSFLNIPSLINPKSVMIPTLHPSSGPHTGPDSAYYPEPGSTTVADASLKTSNEITRLHPTAPLATFCGGGLLEANLTTDIHGLASCEKLTEGEYNWYCCYCGDGPQYIGLSPSCIICNHRRCSNCAVEPRK